MRIDSVNISPAREIERAGRRTRTGILKSPAVGPVAVGRINLDGDDQADRRNHGGEHKAVYAFGTGEYAHWREALGRDDLAPGAFGENLTVAGLDETRLAVGDRLRAGSCTFEITQPRVPCSKLGLALGRDDAPRLFLERARPGMYLRVLETGEIRAGDELTHEPVTDIVDGGDVATLYRAAFDASLPTDERLRTIERNLAVPALSDEWSDLLWKRRAALARGGEPDGPG